MNFEIIGQPVKNMPICGKVRTLLTVTILLLAFPLATGAQQIDYSRSQISITSRQMNVPVEAKFKKFSAQIAFDAAAAVVVKAHLEVDTTSFDVGNDEFNAEATDKDWLNAKRFPKATFVSSNIRSLGNGQFEARGTLSIKGKNQEVTVPFAIKTDAASRRVIEGTLNIRRLQYGIGEGVWKHVDVVADEAQIRFTLQSSSIVPLKK
mgnify:FL=1